MAVAQLSDGPPFRLFFAFPQPAALPCRYASPERVVRCKGIGCGRNVPTPVEIRVRTGSINVLCPVCLERRSYIVSTEVFMGSPSWDVMRTLQGRKETYENNRTRGRVHIDTQGQFYDRHAQPFASPPRSGRTARQDLMNPRTRSAWPHGQAHQSSPVPSRKDDPVLVQCELRTREYTDEKKVASQIVAQNIYRIDYTKLRVTEQGDAAEPEI